VNLNPRYNSDTILFYFFLRFSVLSVRRRSPFLRHPFRDRESRRFPQIQRVPYLAGKNNVSQLVCVLNNIRTCATAHCACNVHCASFVLTMSISTSRLNTSWITNTLPDSLTLHSFHRNSSKFAVRERGYPSPRSRNYLALVSSWRARIDGVSRHVVSRSESLARYRTKRAFLFLSRGRRYRAVSIARLNRTWKCPLFEREASDDSVRNQDLSDPSRIRSLNSRRDWRNRDHVETLRGW